MSRLMSVSHTTEAVVERRKTVTRRLGWWKDKNGRRLIRDGDRLTLCRKVMGRRKGEPIERLAEVQVVRADREPLYWVYGRPGDVAAEGFPDWTDEQFVEFFCRTFRCTSAQMVTRIEWEYL